MNKISYSVPTTLTLEITLQDIKKPYYRRKANYLCNYLYLELSKEINLYKSLIL